MGRERRCGGLQGECHTMEVVKVVIDVRCMRRSCDSGGCQQELSCSPSTYCAVVARQ